MDDRTPNPGKLESGDELLEGDRRWELVQRIVTSEDFQRASQLRNILLYASRMAILRPDENVSEYDVACKILGRRADFSPATDNIVRAQFSNLRHKLTHYFETEGINEPLILSIPKGVYVPVFTDAPPKAEPQAVSEPEPVQAVQFSTEETRTSSAGAPGARRQWKLWALGLSLVFNAALVVLVLLSHRNQTTETPKNQSTAFGNPFVQFLTRTEGEVMIVAPDTSVSLIQAMLKTNLSIPDYIREDFPQQQMAMVKDPAMREVFRGLGDYRTTSIDEAMIAFNFQDTLQRAGVHSTIRYARDLHVRDLSQGNSILIGGPNSDLWVSLFDDQINFRHIDNLAQNTHFFENMHPAPGEQARYENIYSQQNVGYVDVAFVQNPSRTGYVLLINGADKQANDAATRFLLYGRLPTEITSVLNRKDLHKFEFFLRGKHLGGEDDDSFELVAQRLN